MEHKWAFEVKNVHSVISLLDLKHVLSLLCVFSSGTVRQRRPLSRCWSWIRTVRKHPANSSPAASFSSRWGTAGWSSFQMLIHVSCFYNFCLLTLLSWSFFFPSRSWVLKKSRVKRCWTSSPRFRQSSTHLRSKVRASCSTKSVHTTAAPLWVKPPTSALVLMMI